MDERLALHELDRLAEAVRVHSRWYGRYLLALAGGTIAYYVAVNAVAPAAPAMVVLLALCWTGFAVALAGWARRQPVVWQGIRRLRPPLMLVYFALVAATVLLNVTVLKDVPVRWALGAVPALPCLVGAWLVLRR